MSLLFDSDSAPMFTSFLRLDLRAPRPDSCEILLSCWAATGCLEHEREPVLEDRARATRTPDGHWTWRSETPGRAVP